MNSINYGHSPDYTKPLDISETPWCDGGCAYKLSAEHRSVFRPLHLKEGDLHRIVLRQTTFAEALKAGEIKAEGKTNELARFFDLFDSPASEPPALTAR